MSLQPGTPLQEIKGAFPLDIRSSGDGSVPPAITACVARLNAEDRGSKPGADFAGASGPTQATPSTSTPAFVPDAPAVTVAPGLMN